MSFSNFKVELINLGDLNIRIGGNNVFWWYIYLKYSNIKRKFLIFDSFEW